MKEYFTIEREKNSKQNETKEVAKFIEEHKYYSVHIEGLPYGTLVRESEKFSEAFNIYREIKNNFYFYECKVILQRHIKTGNEEKVSTVYSKQIGKDFGIERHLKNILNSLDQLDKMKRLYTSTHSECDKYLSAFSHSLEKINAERLTEEQMRNVFRNVEEKGALRRISKSQIEHLTNLQNNLSSIRSNTNKALDSFKKTEYHRNSQKAIENRVIKDNEYLSTIGLI